MNGKRLMAIVTPRGGGKWTATVTDADTGNSKTFDVEAQTEKDAAFKAMETFDDR